MFDVNDMYDSRFYLYYDLLIFPRLQSRRKTSITNQHNKRIPVFNLESYHQNVRQFRASCQMVPVADDIRSNVVLLEI